MSGSLYLIFIQVASRALTFAGNQVLLRFLSPELLGVSVQLELFSVSVLYFSRESLRVALQRQPQEQRQTAKGDSDRSHSDRIQTQTAINFSYVSALIGLPLALILAYSYFQTASNEVLSSPGFGYALSIYATATIIELLSEPSFVVIQQSLLYRERARSETAAAILKCLVACSTAIFARRLQYPPSALPLAFGQLSYATVLLLTYGRTTIPLASKRGFSLLLQPINDTNNYLLSYFSKPLLRLAGTLYFQSIFKQILTQGDAFILSFLATLSDQGAFALASNYGGLAARLLFQPIEEDSRNTFGRLASSASPTHPDTSTSTSKLSSSNLTTMTTHLTSTLHFYALITILSLSYLDLTLPLFVSLLIGPRWFTLQISRLLSIYAYYIPFTAYNGILDAFVTSVATPAQLAGQSMWMVTFTLAYITAAYLLLNILQLGASGLVVANILNMSLRIAWSLAFIRTYFKRQGVKIRWANCLPHVATVASGLVCAVSMRYGPLAVARGGSTVELIGWAGINGLLLGIAVLYSEQDFLKQHVQQFLPRRLAEKFNLSTPTS